MIHLICPNPAIDRTLLVKSFTKNVPNRPYELKEFPGGKGFNIAYAINFEQPTIDFCVHTILGGHNGKYLQKLAANNKIPLVFTEIDINTRTCNIIMDTESNTIYPIYENSFELKSRLLEKFSQTLFTSINSGDYVVFSGSLMKGMPKTYIADFINKYKKNNIKFFVDTSGQALIKAYEAKPYAIKINDEEILDLIPNEKLKTIDDYVALLKSDFAKDIPYFIITLGAKGIIAKMNNTYIHLSAKKIIAKNPIACGDFFLGALIKFDSLTTDSLYTIKKAISYSTANALNLYPELKEDDIKYFYDNLTIVTY